MGKLLRLCAAGLALVALASCARAEYWRESRQVDCPERLPSCRLLQMVMMGSFDGYDPEDGVSGRVLSAAYPQLCEVSEADMAHFTAEFGESKDAVRENWYIALANGLWASLRAEASRSGGPDPAGRVLLLFLDPESQPDAAGQMARIRADMTEAVLARIAGAVDAPEDFVRWLIQDGEWQARTGAGNGGIANGN